MSQSILHGSAGRPPNDRRLDLISWTGGPKSGIQHRSVLDSQPPEWHIRLHCFSICKAAKEGSMRVIGKACCLLALMLLVPRLALAQASITGTVKDTSGAVLPGVTVE